MITHLMDQHDGNTISLLWLLFLIYSKGILIVWPVKWALILKPTKSLDNESGLLRGYRPSKPLNAQPSQGLSSTIFILKTITKLSVR